MTPAGSHPDLCQAGQATAGKGGWVGVGEAQGAMAPSSALWLCMPSPLSPPLAPNALFLDVPRQGCRWPLRLTHTPLVPCRFLGGSYLFATPAERDRSRRTEEGNVSGGRECVFCIHPLFRSAWCGSPLPMVLAASAPLFFFLTDLPRAILFFVGHRCREKPARVMLSRSGTGAPTNARCGSGSEGPHSAVLQVREGLPWRGTASFALAESASVRSRQRSRRPRSQL